MLIPRAEPFRRELSTFSNSLKDRFSDVKDLQIGNAGGRDHPREVEEHY